MLDVGKMVDAVLDAIDKPRRAFHDRLKALETRAPEKGEDGRDGRDGLPGVPGDKGRDGIDGKDGLGFEDLAVSYDGERTFTFKLERGEKTKAWEFSIPCMIYRGVWRDGAHQRGDAVTHGGSIWIASKDTETKPDTADSDWQLAAKRGRDGKDGKPGDRGATGPNGLRGDRGERGFAL